MVPEKSLNMSKKTFFGHPIFYRNNRELNYGLIISIKNVVPEKSLNMSKKTFFEHPLERRLS